MESMSSGYSNYFASGSTDDVWGVASTGVGHAKIEPGVPYPPARHPMDHMFSWDKGRILQCFQVVYISQGLGQFESTAAGPVQIKAGTVFVLFPGVWHRYRPDLATGWTEDWIELRGPSMTRLLQGEVITPLHPVHVVGVQPSLLAIYEQCHRLAKDAPPEYVAMLGLLGMQILAQLTMLC